MFTLDSEYYFEFDCIVFIPHNEVPLLSFYIMLMTSQWH